MKKLLSLVAAMTALTMLSITGAQAGGSDGGYKQNQAKRYSSMMNYKRQRPQIVYVQKKVIIGGHFKKHKVKKLKRKIKKLKHLIRHLRKKEGSYHKIKKLKRVLHKLKHKKRALKRFSRKKIIFKKVRIVRHSRPCGKSRYVIRHKNKFKGNDRPRRKMRKNGEGGSQLTMKRKRKGGGQGDPA